MKRRTRLRAAPKPWTAAAEAALRELYGDVSLEEIAARLQRTVAAVRSRAKVLQLRRGSRRPWTVDDDRALRALYPHLPTAEIAQRLGRSLASVSGHAGGLGLRKSAAYLASPAACRLRRGDQVGKPYWFRPGHVPANKGLRRPGYAPGRMRETQFKPGQKGTRYMPVGSTRLCDGYVYRKISDVPKVPWTRNWTLEHLRIWTAAHGPLPPGHALAFRNGDRLDVRLENLECITRRELMRRNSVHNLPEPLPQTIQLLGALKRQIRRRQHATA